jgi:hypothetical protein
MFKKSLNSTKTVFKKPRNLWKSLTIIKKIKILKKSSYHFKKASNSLKISLKCHAFLKKSLNTFSKKSLVAIAA